MLSERLQVAFRHLVTPPEGRFEAALAVGGVGGGGAVAERDAQPPVGEQQTVGEEAVGTEAPGSVRAVSVPHPDRRAVVDLVDDEGVLEDTSPGADARAGDLVTGGDPGDLLRADAVEVRRRQGRLLLTGTAGGSTADEEKDRREAGEHTPDVDRHGLAPFLLGPSAKHYNLYAGSCQ